MDFVLKLVRNECRRCGVKFQLVETPMNYGGSFDAETKTLQVCPIQSDTYAGSRKSIRVDKPKVWRINALHEMVHMWQWYRKDPNWHKEYLPGFDLPDVILTYDDGERSFRRGLLRESAKCLMALEFEAESVSMILASSMGIDYDRARMIRAAKAYVYSYYVLAETGCVVDYRLRRKWAKFMVPDHNYDLDRALLSKMIDVMNANRHLISAAWIHGKFVGWPYKK